MVVKQSEVVTVIECREYLPGALAEPYRESLASAHPFKVQNVTVDKEGPLFAVGQLDGFLAVPAEFEEGAEAAFFGAGDGPGAKQVAHVHVAAGYRVVRQLLVRTPVHVLEVAARDQCRLAHLGGLKGHIQLHIVRVVVRVSQVGEGLGDLICQLCLEGLQGLRCDDPGRDGRCEVLRVEGTQWDVLPFLEVSR